VTVTVTESFNPKFSCKKLSTNWGNKKPRKRKKTRCKIIIVKLENERGKKVEQKSTQNFVISELCFLWMHEECKKTVLELCKEKV